MQILLRTAGTLERACTQAIAKLEIAAMTRTSVHVIDYAGLPVDTFLADRAKTIHDNLEQALALLEAQWTIRRLKGEANAPKISGLMTEEKYLDAAEKQLEAILPKATISRYDERSAVRVKHSVREVQMAVQSIRERLNSSTALGAPDSIEFPTLMEAQIRPIERQIEGIRRRRIEINDLKARENLNTMITLPDKVVATLRQHGILESETR